MNNQITMKEYLEENVNNDFAQLENISSYLQKSAEAIAMLTKKTKEYDYEFKQLKEKNNQIESQVNYIMKEICTLSSKEHSIRLRKLKTRASDRVNDMLKKEEATCEYVLFERYFHFRIYTDLSYKLNLGSYKEMDMCDYEKPNSTYSKSLEYVENWTPSKKYIDDVLKKLSKLRDNGFLASEKCRALTAYLENTDNGKVNPFTY